MQKQDTPVFRPEVPPDLEHARLIREEAFDWLDTHYPGLLSFTSGTVLRMVGEQDRRWLVGRLRQHGIGNQEEFSMPDTADALTVLFLRSRGVKFREAVDAVLGRKEESRSAEPRYGGVWNRLIDTALKRLRRRLTARLLGSAVFSLLRDTKDHPNCLVIVKRHGRNDGPQPEEEAKTVQHDYAFRTIPERPAPSCWMLSPFREALFLDRDELPTNAEVRARHFLGLRIQTERDVYEVLLGTMSPSSVSPDSMTLRFVGRILDIVFLDFEEFLRSQSSRRFEITTEPGLSSSDDLQLWLITQLLDTIYPGSLCEISESSESPQVARVLATSVGKPWEPPLWDPPKSLEMLSGYASRIGIPLVVESVEQPWTSLIESVEPEMRYLERMTSNDNGVPGYSAMALPIPLSSGASIGALYLLMPRIDGPRMEIEVRVLKAISRIIGEIVENDRGRAIHTANVSAEIATFTVLKREEFRAALLDLLQRKADLLGETGQLQRDMRLPFLMLSVHSPDPDEFDPIDSGRLKQWLVETLRYLEWGLFARSHLSGAAGQTGEASFIGELPGVGVLIALDNLVSKDELDRIRSAFPKTINRTSPTNSPVKLVAWVLDIPARRILNAAEGPGFAGTEQTM